MKSKKSGITIILGTLCSESREQIPRFLKILDYVGFSNERVKTIFVDRKKNAGSFDISDLTVTLVPTIIFYKDRNEIGRIIETPKINLEEDNADIIFSSK